MAQRRLFDPDTGLLIDEQPDIVAAEEVMDADDMTATPETQEFRFQQNALSGQATGAAGGIDTRVPIARSPALRGDAPSVEPGMFHQDRLPVREATIAGGNISQYSGLEGFGDIKHAGSIRGREQIAGLEGFSGDTYKTGVFDMAQIGEGFGFDEDQIGRLMNYEMGGGAEGKMFHGLMQLSGASGKGFEIEGATGKQKKLDLDIDDPRHMQVVQDLGESSMRSESRDAEGNLLRRGGPRNIGGDKRGLLSNQRNIDRTFRKAGRVSGNEIGMDMVVKGIAIAGLAAMTGGALGPLLAGVLGPALMGSAGFAAGGIGAGAITGASAGLAGGAMGGLASSAFGGFEGGLTGTLANIGKGAGLGAVGGGLVGGVAGGFGGPSGQTFASGTQVGGTAMRDIGVKAGTGLIQNAQTGATEVIGQGGRMMMTGGQFAAQAPQLAAGVGAGFAGVGSGGMSAGGGVSGQGSEPSFIEQAGNITSRFGPSAKVVGQGLHSAVQEAGARGAAVQANLQEAQSAGVAQSAQARAAQVSGLQSNIRAKSNIFQDNPFYDPIEDFGTGQVGVI